MSSLEGSVPPPVNKAEQSETSTDGGFKRFKDLVKQLLRRAAEKKRQIETQERLHEEDAEELVYRKEDGITSLTSVAEENADARAIKAEGFRDCGGLIVLSGNGFGVLHSSPHVLDELEGRPSDYVINAKDTDLLAHINHCLHQLYPKSEREEELGLSSDQLAVAQEDLVIVAVGGNEQLAAKLRALFRYRANYDRGNDVSWDLPQLPPQNIYLYYTGTGPKTVLASQGKVFLREEVGDKQVFQIYPPQGDRVEDWRMLKDK